ncbi:MAG: myristylated protein [Barrevirus sp.]|uniref:Myristylated protein n=1 Tax=Barrevirus sp. TaxID=2487763 RepID=A0A3G4ZR21_9VIRU|nr:MAG: myristylated protein [Barrevirus sp.]
MGTCNSKGQSRAFTLAELADLPVNAIKEMGNGCGPSIDGLQGGSCYDWLTKRGFSYPDNGEFNWGGLGSSCPMCSDVNNGYGCDNCGGAQAIGGSRGTVKRIAFTGDPTNCCLSNGQKIIDNKTCDPMYRSYITTACDDTMFNYCNNGNWQTNQCRSWTQALISAGRTNANIALSNYCSLSNNFSKDECQEWCSATRNQPNMKSACDTASISYCKNNPTDPQCTCSNPPTTITQLQDLMATSKVCWYKPCQTLDNDNYITSSMEDQKRNCVSTTCLIDVNNVTISGTDNSVKFNNSCATNLLKPQYQQEQVPVLPTQNTPPFSTTNIIVSVFALICLLILIILAYYFFFRK